MRIRELDLWSGSIPPSPCCRLWQIKLLNYWHPHVFVPWSMRIAIPGPWLHVEPYNRVVTVVLRISWTPNYYVIDDECHNALVSCHLANEWRDSRYDELQWHKCRFFEFQTEGISCLQHYNAFTYRGKPRFPIFILWPYLILLDRRGGMTENHLNTPLSDAIIIFAGCFEVLGVYSLYIIIYGNIIYFHLFLIFETNRNNNYNQFQQFKWKFDLQMALQGWNRLKQTYNILLRELRMYSSRTI